MDEYNRDIRVILNSKTGYPSQIEGQLENYIDERHLKFALLEIIIPNNIKLVNVKEDTIKIEKRILPHERETAPKRNRRSYHSRPGLDLRNYFTWVVTYLKRYNMGNDQARMLREAQANSNWREAEAIFGEEKASAYRGTLIHFNQKIIEATAPPPRGVMDFNFEIFMNLSPVYLRAAGFSGIPHVDYDVCRRFEDVLKAKGFSVGRLFRYTLWYKIYNGIFDNDLVKIAKLMPEMTPSRLMVILDPMVKAFHEYIAERRSEDTFEITDNRILAIIEEKASRTISSREPTEDIAVSVVNLPSDTGLTPAYRVTEDSSSFEEEPEAKEEPETVEYGGPERPGHSADSDITSVTVINLPSSNTEEPEVREEPETVEYGGSDRSGHSHGSDITSVTVINLPSPHPETTPSVGPDEISSIDESEKGEEMETTGYEISGDGGLVTDTVEVQPLPVSPSSESDGNNAEILESVENDDTKTEPDETGKAGGASEENDPRATTSESSLPHTKTVWVEVSDLNSADPLKAISEVIPNELKRMRDFGINTKFKYITHSHKIRISVSANETVILGGKMPRIFSLPERMQGPGHFESKYCVDPWIDYRILMVYSDITRPISLGEGEHSVVQVMPLLTKSVDKSFHYVFDNPLYLDLNKNHIRNINLSVHNEVGEPIELLSEARITLKLVIKKT